MVFKTKKEKYLIPLLRGQTADAVEDVPPAVVLAWTAGEFATKHDVYLGTDFDDVNEILLRTVSGTENDQILERIYDNHVQTPKIQKLLAMKPKQFKNSCDSYPLRKLQTFLNTLEGKLTLKGQFYPQETKFLLMLLSYFINFKIVQ